MIAGPTLPKVHQRSVYISCAVEFFSGLGLASDIESFKEAAGVAELVGIDAVKDPLPDPTKLTGTVVIGGATGHLYEREPWMDRLIEFTKQLLDQGQVNVLGMCFGHQVIVHALGGKVKKNPNGREVGIKPIKRTAAGQRHPVFQGLGDHFEAYQSYLDIVTELPTDGRVEILATNDNDQIQALSVQHGSAVVVTVGFHLDLSVPILTTIINSRRAIYIQEGFMPDNAAIDALITDTQQRGPEADKARHTIIRNFLNLTNPKI